MVTESDPKLAAKMINMLGVHLRIFVFEVLSSSSASFIDLARTSYTQAMSMNQIENARIGLIGTSPNAGTTLNIYFVSDRLGSFDLIG